MRYNERVKYIYLSGKNGAGKKVMVDDDDHESLNKYKWHLSHKYACRRAWNKEEKKNYTIFMHRVINKTPDDLFTDHINHDTFDNRKENLRSVTKSENAYNSKTFCTNKSGYRGVYWQSSMNKWKAAITRDYVEYTLGYADTPEEAYEFRKAAETFH